ncbi:YueI family protein [Pseudalkalibacillus caeni]|uniref:YueI family protein n=1 Tax=Exobacillus caeni TaxID=2574798 RepID=UPI0014852117|nr:YueI family protein [Pseudalkalibacillus caeni]
MNQEMENILNAGMTGTPETKPAERIVFLSSIRERVKIALTYNQVLTKDLYEEAARAIERNKNCHLYLNGDLPYEAMSKYIKKANKSGVSFTIVNRGDKTSPLGLVLASDTAIDEPNIFVEDARFKREMS